MQPGAGVDFSGVSPQAEVDAEPLVDRLINIIPTNPINALANGDVLSIIFFSILVGIAILVLGERGKPVKDVIDSGAEIMFRITHWVMEAAPFGVFALIACWLVERGRSIGGAVVLHAFGNAVAIGLYAVAMFRAEGLLALFGLTP